MVDVDRYCTVHMHGIVAGLVLLAAARWAVTLFATVGLKYEMACSGYLVGGCCCMHVGRTVKLMPPH